MTILTLQYLRGVAALMVVIYHLGVQVKRFGYHGYFPEWPAAGVDLFFLLSGFLMWAITAERNQSPGQFLVRRAARIMPLYYLLTTLVVCIMIFAPTLLLTGRFLFTQTLGSYLFLGLPDITGEPYPVVRVGWTLNIEMLFYLIFSISLLAPRSRRGIIVSSFFIMIVFLGSIILPQSRWTYLYTSSVMFEFVYGMGVAEIYRRGYFRKISASLSWLLVGAGAGAILFTSPNAPLRGLLVGIPATAVFVGFLVLNDSVKDRPLGWLKLIGDASYSLYLTHLIVLSFALQVWRLGGLPTKPSMLWLFIPFALVLCFATAIMVYRLVEVPLTEYFQRKINKPSGIGWN